jgi:hypothetical protein
MKNKLATKAPRHQEYFSAHWLHCEARDTRGKIFLENPSCLGVLVAKIRKGEDNDII